MINFLDELSITQNDDNLPSFARSNKCWSQYGTVAMLAIATTHVGLFSIAKSNDNKAIVYNDHLFFLSIVLSNTINKIVVLLTAESSNNNIQ